MSTFIISAIVIGAMIFAAYKGYRNHKDGGCGGGCSGCSHAGKCHH